MMILSFLTTPVTERNCLFGPEYDNLMDLPHTSTCGTSYRQHVSKVANFAKLNFDDVCNSNIIPSKKLDRDTCELNFAEDESAIRFLTSRKQLSNRNVFEFIEGLSEKYKETSASIKFLEKSIASDFKAISELDPFFVVMGREAPKERIDQNWFLITENKIKIKPEQSADENAPEDPFVIVENNIDLEPEPASVNGTTNCLNAFRGESGKIAAAFLKQDQLAKTEKQKNEQLLFEPVNHFTERYIIYPFVFPPKNAMCFDHIVLIIIDQEEEKIYYYDSKGLTSDDPERMGMFRDKPQFNMHKNLVQLASMLFKKCGEVIENVAIHQTDPVNCGVYVCKALERLYQGMSVPEALSYNPLEESISDARKRMGIAYMQAKQEKNDRYIQQARQEKMERHTRQSMQKLTEKRVKNSRF